MNNDILKNGTNINISVKDGILGAITDKRVKSGGVISINAVVYIFSHEQNRSISGAAYEPIYKN